MYSSTKPALLSLSGAPTARKVPSSERDREDPNAEKAEDDSLDPNSDHSSSRVF